MRRFSLPLARPSRRRAWALPLMGALLAGAAGTIRAETPPTPPAPPPAYADLADMTDSAALVLKLQIRKQAAVEPARAGDVRAGWARLYVEAEPQGVLLGPQVMLPVVSYLLDVPLDAKGKAPQLKKHVVLVFARAVPGKLGEIQLVAPDSQVEWSEASEARVRKLLADLAAPDAPGRVSGVAQAMYVAGTLAGEGETQIFLATTPGADGRSSPAALTILHKPGAPTRWSASFSEVMDGAGAPPVRESLAWYRLACFLPDTLPEEANVSENAEDKAQARADYALARQELGDCGRRR